MADEKESNNVNFQLYWLIFGIFIAFSLQVTYDSIGLYFGQEWKITLGWFMVTLISIWLSLYAYQHKGKKK